MLPYNYFGFSRGFLPPIPFRPARRIATLDQDGIFEICTTGLVETTTGTAGADYGISRSAWCNLPCQSVVLWKVRHPVSAAGAALPVSVIVPTGVSDSTVPSSSASSASGSRVPVVDNKGTQVTGSDVTAEGTTTEHLVYIDKSAGIFRLLGVTAAAPATAAASSNQN